MVLSEKVSGEIYVEKLRAISLQEADFNWLTKLVFAFAKQMMLAAKVKGIIPVDQFAKPGTTAGEGIMAKTFFNNIHRTTRWLSSVTIIDLSDCYDQVLAHPICCRHLAWTYASSVLCFYAFRPWHFIFVLASAKQRSPMAAHPLTQPLALDKALAWHHQASMLFQHWW